MKNSPVIIVQSEVHFQHLAPLANIEKDAIYSSYNILLALGHMSIATETCCIKFILSVDNLEGRLSCLKEDLAGSRIEPCELDQDEVRMLKSDIEECEYMIKSNRKIIENLL